MKKTITFLFSILICSFLFSNTNTVITGTLGMRSMPCPNISEGCLTVDVMCITNDTASFVLVKGGNFLWNSDELEGCDVGNTISCYGNITEKIENTNQLYSEITEEIENVYQIYYELSITAILRDKSSEYFEANCLENTDEDKTTSPTVKIENDSIIIEYIKYDQCCPQYTLKVSEIINDTLYVTFSDMAIEACNCLCNFSIRISTVKATSDILKVYYNGITYDLNTSVIEQYGKSDFELFPNPTDGIVNIKGIENLNNYTYEVYNSNGQLIQKGDLKNSIDLSSNKGINFLAIIENQKVVERRKIIIK